MDVFFNVNALQMTQNQWFALSPYICLCAAIALSLILSTLKLSSGFQKLFTVGFLGIFIALLVERSADTEVFVFGNALLLDPRATFVGIAVAALALVSILLTEAKDSPLWLPVFFICLLGMTLLPATHNWVSFFIALETLSIAAYILASFEVQKTAGLEAGFKYLMMGAFSSAFLLLAMAFLYGVSAKLDFAGQFEYLQTLGESSLSYFAAIMFVCAIAFKISCVPFHMWAADVYQGARSPFAAFLASASKLSVACAALLVFQRVGFLTLSGIGPVIAIIGVMSILVGSFQAFHQRYLRRMLAYSGVVNAGYAILLFPLGYMAFDSLIFYLFVYGLALVGLFAYAQFSVSVLKEEEKSDLALDHMATARKMIPKFLIGLAVICFFSLAGLPPFPGFFAKYLVIADLWKAEHYFSMTLVLLGSLLGLGYYLGAIGELSFGKSDVKAKEQLVRAPITSYALIGLVLTALFIASYFLI